MREAERGQALDFTEISAEAPPDASLLMNRRPDPTALARIRAAVAARRRAAAEDPPRRQTAARYDEAFLHALQVTDENDPD